MLDLKKLQSDTYESKAWLFFIKPVLISSVTQPGLPTKRDDMFWKYTWIEDTFFCISVRFIHPDI